LGYTNVSFPYDYKPEEGNMKTVSYFDDVLWNSESTHNFQATNAFHPQYTNVKGMMTGKLVKNLRTNTWQKMILYYNYHGNVIQDFHLTNRNNLIRKDNQYRFNNELLKSRYVKINSANAVLSNKIMSYDYDHFGRKIKFKYSLNGVEKTIASYKYDATGRMSQKLYSPSTAIGSNQSGLWTNLTTWQGASVPTLSDQVTINQGHTVTIPSGQTVSAGTLFDKGILQNFGTLQMGTLAAGSGTGTLQTLDYKYHIRGALKAINTDANNNLTNNLFSYKLDYEDDGTFYDGNIKKQSWRSNLDNVTRSYTYNYDKASRIIQGTYASTKANENYALNAVSYDENGNIKTLSRNGLKSNNTFGLIDNLNYTYNANSNKILKVDDASNEISSFKDVAGNDYDYWQDGSLKKDNNKEITQIDYNYLKLPEQITLTGGRWIKYDYDANGTKLKKTLSTGQVTDYEEDEIYENGILYQTTHDEGRIVNGIFEYNINDHLGNLRVSFKDSLGIAKAVQYENSGAFGESLEGINFSKPIKNNFTYSTYEKENDFGIGVFDAHARVYDPITPRFWQIDPLAELSRHFSPTVYGNNNPLRFIDPDGMRAVWNGKYGSESGYNDDVTGESRSWNQVQEEYGIGDPSTHTDEQGNVIAVYNDGNNGVYQHKNSDLKEIGFEPSRMSLSTTKAEKKGTTKFWDEFLNPNSQEAQGRISFGESWNPIITKLHNLAMEMDLKEIGENSKLHKAFDLKNNLVNAPFGVMTGKLLDGEYATARSAGNYLAGFNGRTGTYFGIHISFETYMKLAGALQVGKYNKSNAAGIVTWGTAYGPSPWYGEIPYTGRMVKQGWIDGK
jgi:RHS repeat-associated protein